MAKLEQIKNEVKRLSKDGQEALLDWLTNLLEDELELTDAFKAEIERGEADIAAGRFRIRQPGSPTGYDQTILPLHRRKNPRAESRRRGFDFHCCDPALSTTLPQIQLAEVQVTA